METLYWFEIMERVFGSFYNVPGRIVQIRRSKQFWPDCPAFWLFEC